MLKEIQITLAGYGQTPALAKKHDDFSIIAKPDGIDSNWVIIKNDTWDYLALTWTDPDALKLSVIMSKHILVPPLSTKRINKLLYSSVEDDFDPSSFVGARLLEWQTFSDRDGNWTLSIIPVAPSRYAVHVLKARPRSTFKIRSTDPEKFTFTKQDGIFIFPLPTLISLQWIPEI